MTVTLRPGAAYEAQLAARTAELLPDLTLTGQLELVVAMTPDDMSTTLAWLASYAPAVFDAGLVRDRALVARLKERIGETSTT